MALARIRWKDQWDWRAGGAGHHARRLTGSQLRRRTRIWYFDLLSAMGRHAEAYTRLKRAAALDPVSLTIHYDFGLHFARIGDYAQAEEWLRKAIELDPASGFVDHISGEMYAEQNKFSEAAAELRKSIELAGANPHFVAMLGVRAQPSAAIARRR